MDFIVLLIVLLQVLRALCTRCYTTEGPLGICKLLNDCNVVVDVSKPLAKCYNTSMHCCPYSTTIPSSIATTISASDASRVATKDAIKRTTNVELIFPTDCGWTPMHARAQVRGGYNVEPDEYSWLASLLYGNGNSYRDCVGSVINSRYVLTAAHCVTGAPIRAAGGLTSVRLGALDVNGHICDYGTKSCTHYQEFGIEKIIPHRSYSADNSIVNDIALIRLNRAIVFGPKLIPICLPFGNNNIPEPTVNDVLIVAGWHLTKDRNDSPSKRDTIVVICETDKCNNHSLNNRTHLCFVAAGKSTCNGDSGGPLMYQFERRRVGLEGIVSYGVQDCTQSKSPGVYTRVRFYESWLRHNIKM